MAAGPRRMEPAVDRIAERADSRYAPNKRGSAQGMSRTLDGGFGGEILKRWCRMAVDTVRQRSSTTARLSSFTVLFTFIALKIHFEYLICSDL